MKKKTIALLTAAVLMCGTAVIISGCKKEKKQLSEETKEAQYKLCYTGGEYATGVVPPAAELTAGTKLTLAENVFFKKSGYEFDGWKWQDSVYAVGDEFEMPAKDVTFEACWARLYTLTYTFGTQSHAAENATLPASVEKRSGAEVTLACVEAESGYSFAGWIVAGESEVRAAGTQYAMHSDVIMTAKWVALGSVSYASGGGTGTDPEVKTYEAGETVTIAQNPYSRTGYRFAGWTVTADGAEVSVTESGGVYSFTMPQSGVLVSARWKKEFTLSYSLGEDNHGLQSAPVDANTYIEGESVSLYAQDVPAAQGWKFDGWQVEEAESKQMITVTEGAFLMPDDNAIATAKWVAITYSVVYARGEHSSAEEDITEEATVTDNDGKLRLKSASAFAAQLGYAFCGWQINNADYTADSEVDLVDLIPQSGTTITVTAKWSEVEYTLIFERGGHAQEEEDLTDEGVKITDNGGVYELPAAFLPEGSYRFAGWKFGNEIYAAGENVNLSELISAESEEITFTAQWERIYQITVNLDGGSWEEEANKFEAGDFAENETIDFGDYDEPVRSGHVFAGWITGDEDETVYRKNTEQDSYTVTGLEEGDEIAFSAKWERIYKVTVSLDGGSWQEGANKFETGNFVNNQTIRFGDYDEPVRSGYEFVGWIISDEDGNIYRKGAKDSYTVTDSVTFKAKWAELIPVKIYRSFDQLLYNAGTPTSVVYVADGSALPDVLPTFDGIDNSKVVWYLAEGEVDYFSEGTTRVSVGYTIEKRNVLSDGCIYIYAVGVDD